jgi:hypothetical protein
MVGRAGLHENYHSQTGRPGCNSRMDYSWSAAMAITIAMGDLTRARPPRLYRDSFVARSIHIGVRVRDRKIYGRGKEASIHVANRTRDTISGLLQFSLPNAWKLQTHNSACGPEHGWKEAREAQVPFELGPHARYERPIRFVIPRPLDLEDNAYTIRIQALTSEDGPAMDETILRLEGPAMLPLPWLTADTATSFQSLLHSGPPFCWVQDRREIGRSAPGLVGLLNGQLQFLGHQAPSVHLGQRDFIKHALKLVQHLPTATSLRRALERLLAEGIPPQVAEDEARELLETVVQQTRDLTEGWGRD